jgi:hypothetical protein
MGPVLTRRLERQFILPYSINSAAIREVDPATGAPWAKAGVNSAELGMEVA